MVYQSGEHHVEGDELSRALSLDQPVEQEADDGQSPRVEVMRCPLQTVCPNSFQSLSFVLQ